LSHVFESAEIVLMYQSKKIRSHRTVEKGRLDSMTPLYSQISKCHHLKNPSRVGIDGTAESECDRCSSKGLFTRERNTKNVVVSTADSCQVPTEDMGIKLGVTLHG
jgi:hypothetical protein